MIKEIQAKTLLNRVKGPDDWFGLYYSMNLFRGCQHQCIYCDSRSECYQIENFNTDVLVKANAIDLLHDELGRKRVVGTIGTGSMNDPYMPLEKQICLTRRALKVIAQFGFPVHAITKSDLVLRDLDLFADLQAQTYAAVTFTVTTADDELSKKIEPGAPVTSRRLKAMRSLAEKGILTGITLMPILPFIADHEDNLRRIITLVAAHGGRYVLPALGMTLRDRQRAYYFKKLDRLFPGLRGRYVEAFGGQYFAPAQNASRLEAVLGGLCEECDLPTRMPVFLPRKRACQPKDQPHLF
ncbi:MAG: radical SAM protein [Anaerolineales bacterium]|nr:radical SAM protein [Anaerolineales bacterium]